MGREIKRVPMGFDWPLEQRWKSFINPRRDEEPPTGEAWQLWETVSDGSPISPAFATPEELIDWMSQPDKSGRRGSEYPDYPWAQGYKREHAEAFVRGPGWALSGVVIGGRVMGGVEAVFVQKESKE